MALSLWKRNRVDIFYRLSTMQERDRQTNKQTNRQTDRSQNCNTDTNRQNLSAISSKTVLQNEVVKTKSDFKSYVWQYFGRLVENKLDA